MQHGDSSDELMEKKRHLGRPRRFRKSSINLTSDREETSGKASRKFARHPKPRVLDGFALPMHLTKKRSRDD